MRRASPAPSSSTPPASSAATRPLRVRYRWRFKPLHLRATRSDFAIHRLHSARAIPTRGRSCLGVDGAESIHSELPFEGRAMAHSTP
mmetsp:Transcript_63790/g.161677  ORF Transcript_63790/g.161677 Transcript_63790/m.161677 type:complete len:87 (-) Transcript_63790:9-269(-)